MGSSLMEAYSNLILTWAFTRPLRCHGTCPWVRRLMPVDLWVHRIVSPEFVFANHQPSPRLNLNVSAVHSQNAIIKMLRDFTSPGWGIKIIKSQLQPLILLISPCTVYFNSKVQLPYGQCATGCRIHYIQIRLDNLQDFAPTTEQITTGSRHRVVATKSDFGHPTWFNPQFTGVPFLSFPLKLYSKGIPDTPQGKWKPWHWIVVLIDASCAAINPNFQEMAWKSLSLEYQHSALWVVRSFQLEVDSPSLKLDLNKLIKQQACWLWA